MRRVTLATLTDDGDSYQWHEIRTTPQPHPVGGLGLRSDASLPQRVWITVLVIVRAYRHQGNGKATIAALARELRTQGVSEMYVKTLPASPMSGF